MISVRWTNLLGAFAVTAVLAACSTPPYVHNEGEFNRESDVFRKGVTDRSEVVVCYRKGSATPAQISRLARAECQRFGKSAVFDHQTLAKCPLITPVAAVFECLGPEDHVYSN